LSKLGGFAVVDKLFDNGVSVQIMAKGLGASIPVGHRSWLAGKRCKHDMIPEKIA
jgi:hypothetical protein